ncbi:MAG: S41 family peptidase [Alistipes sp.]|nr:S41 family peptidase [Alistipes sp.]
MKNNLLRRMLVAVAVATALVSLLYAKRNDFGLGRAMELTVNMMRELSLNYVDTLDYEKLLQGATQGMVRDLDPYTAYIPEQEMSEFELLTTGKYGGVGSLIRLKGDYVIFAQPYEGSPSDRAGIKIGDRILEINGESAKGFTTEQVSSRLKGDAGTPVKVKIERLDGSHHEVEMTRERISIPAIPYVGWVAEGIGYIRHSDFTEGSFEEMRAAIEKLRSTGPLEGLVLDYRSNGGGLMQEAVKIVSLFTPKGTEVVRTKGRKEEKSYKTQADPLYPDLKLAVLVNGSSASAAEIVAGSLQDLDRAVLVGQRTYGKGLVQTTVPIGYNSMAKITTSKYHIPSGRCIQAIDYSNSQQGDVHQVPDSLITEFQTRGGRKVYDGGGVMPDIRLEPEYISRFAMTLYGLGYIEDFGDDYIRRKGYQPIDPRTFNITEADFQDFKAFLKDKEIPYESESRQALRLIKEAAKNDRFKELEEELARLESEVKDDTQTNLETYREEVEEQLRHDIIQRHAYTRGVTENVIPRDKALKRAIETLQQGEEYARILREQDTERK